MTDLRSKIDTIVEEHFDPSLMGRAQAVDDIMAAISEHNEALALRSLPPSPDHKAGQGTIQTSVPQYVIHVDPANPPLDADVVRGHAERASRAARSRGKW